MPRTIIISGPRDYWPRPAIQREFVRLDPDDTLIVHGACPSGVDRVAAEEAIAHGVSVRPYPADWDAAEKTGLPRGAAGPIRNAEMLAAHPEVECWVFHPDPVALEALVVSGRRGSGTADFVRQARAQGREVRVFGGEG